ncbi:O-antigen ligase family protein [Arenibacter sp. F26102]|uniref:O-antigen ligase family protein n=1 Tax=Arenibacter sp. F26102 TaxID=2926416 RepID=UPI001FF22B68|nr:O-antigen ligase family protein [Arenibacter sp. F26102]MCK0147053.1 O-antigen ligase family protein [Arenibacter sp. F26102]
MHDIKKGLYSNIEASGASGALDTEEAYISGGFENRFRLSGPFRSSISFSYFAITSFILTLYMYLRSKRKVYLYYLGLLFIASILSQTRSLLLAEICLVFGFLFFAPFKNHGLYKLIIFCFAVLSLALLFATKDFLSNGGNSRITSVSSEGESDIRPWLWFTGVYAVINYPLGITKEDYTEAKMQIYRQNGKSGILHLSAHNGLINIGFHYSFVGYILFFFLIKFLLKNINLLNPEYAVFFRLVLLAYLIHSSFHNNFILNADYPFLMVLMLISVDYFHFRPNKNSFNVANNEQIWIAKKISTPTQNRFVQWAN